MKAMKNLARTTNKHLLGHSSSKRKTSAHSASEQDDKSSIHDLERTTSVILSGAEADFKDFKLPQKAINSQTGGKVETSQSPLNTYESNSRSSILSQDNWEKKYYQLTEKYQTLHKKYTVLMSEKKSVNALSAELEKERQENSQLRKELSTMHDSKEPSDALKSAQIKITEQNEEIQKLLEKQLLLESNLMNLRYDAIDLIQNDEVSSPRSFTTSNKNATGTYPKTPHKKKKTWWGKTKKVRMSDDEDEHHHLKPVYNEKMAEVYSNQIFELEKYKAKAEEEIKNLQREKEALDKKLNQTELQLKALQKSITVENDKSTLNASQKEKSNIIIQAQEETIARLTAEVKELENSLKLVQAPSIKTENMLNELKTTISSLQEKNAKLKEENRQLTKRLEENDLIKISMKDEITRLKNECEKLRNQGDLQASVLKEKADKYAVMVGNLLQQKDILQKEISKIREVQCKDAILAKKKIEALQTECGEKKNIRNSMSSSSSSSISSSNITACFEQSPVSKQIPQQKLLSPYNLHNQVSASTTVPTSVDITPISKTYESIRPIITLYNRSGAIMDSRTIQTDNIFNVNPSDQLLTRSILRKWNSEKTPEQKANINKQPIYRNIVTDLYNSCSPQLNTSSRIVYRSLSPPENYKSNQFCGLNTPSSRRQKKPVSLVPIESHLFNQKTQPPNSAKIQEYDSSLNHKTRIVHHDHENEAANKNRKLVNNNTPHQNNQIVNRKPPQTKEIFYNNSIESKDSLKFKSFDKSEPIHKKKTDKNFEEFEEENHEFGKKHTENNEVKPKLENNEAKPKLENNEAKPKLENNEAKPKLENNEAIFNFELSNNSTLSSPKFLELKNSDHFVNDLEKDGGKTDASYILKRKNTNNTDILLSAENYKKIQTTVPDLTSEKINLPSYEDDLKINDSLHRMLSMQQSTFFEVNSSPKLELEAAAKLFNFKGSIEKLDQMFHENIDRESFDLPILYT